MPTLNVNGKSVTVDVPAETPLLWTLRDELASPARNSDVDGALRSVHGASRRRGDALLHHPISAAAGKAITTIEAIGAHPSAARCRRPAAPGGPLQCGYCQSGQIMQASGLLAKNPKPSDKDIDEAMSGNICRCGTYQRIRAAIKAAAQEA